MDNLADRNTLRLDSELKGETLHRFRTQEVGQRQKGKRGWLCLVNYIISFRSLKIEYMIVKVDVDMRLNIIGLYWLIKKTQYCSRLPRYTKFKKTYNRYRTFYWQSANIFSWETQHNLCECRQ